MTSNNQELQDSIEYVNIGIERPSVELINGLNTALKEEQAKNAVYKDQLQDELDAWTDTKNNAVETKDDWMEGFCIQRISAITARLKGEEG